MAQSPRDRRLALDVYDWCHLLGHGPTTWERWAEVFRKGRGERVNARHWLRLRKQWERAGVPFELVAVEHPGQARRVLVRLPSEAKYWADAVLDPV
ncbi:MAG: hypothetical protein JKY65_26580 [Planctomycetes bacterium]|nr:hypothetical protein [Planctomycetota bacterium]